MNKKQPKSKALFLDRDGVINIDKGYVSKISDFEFVDGIFNLATKYQNEGYIIIIVTNQSGIGRGYYTEEDFHILNDWMIKQFESRGISITKTFYCPYHSEHGIGKYKKDSPDRKPKPGMLLKAQKQFNIDMTNSIIYGDKQKDVEAGKAAGLGKCVLIESGELPSAFC